MTSTRTLRDYLASLPEGVDDQLVSPDLKKVSTGAFITADQLFAVSEIANSALQEVQQGANITIDNTDPQRPVISATAAAQVNSDWNAVSGAAQILNKPTLGTASAQDVGYFATAAQGLLASTALQPAAIGVSVQAYSSVLQATTASFTTALLTKLNGIASGAEVNVNADWNAVSGGAQILNKPTLGALAAKSSVDIADIDATGTPSGTTYLRGDGSWSTPAGGGGGAVDSVNGQTGVVVLDADNIDDTSTTHKFATAAELSKLAGIEANADVTDAGNVGSSINGATAKTTPVDADTVPLIDSAASNALKKVTWADIKATLKTYFDTLYQPVAAKLTTLAGQTWAADSYTYYTSSSAAAIGTITSFGRSIAAAVDGSAARTLLGLGSLATASTINNGNWSGTDLSVANGGTGLSTLTANNVILGNGASSPSFVAPGAVGNVLQSNGTTWVSGAAPASGPYSVASVSNISNVAAVDLSIDSTKEQTIFELQDVVPASDGAHLQVQFSTDSGSTYTVSVTSLLHRISTTTVNSGGSTASTTGAALIESVGSDTSEYGITGRFAFSQLSGERAIITGSGHYINNAGALVPFWAVAQAQVTTAITNVRWKFSTGNLESGRIITINMEAV